MNRKLGITIIFSLLIGVDLGIFLGPAIGSAISFLAKIFCALFLEGALGNIALGVVIGAVSALFMNWLLKTVLGHKEMNKLGVGLPPTWGAL